MLNFPLGGRTYDSGGPPEFMFWGSDPFGGGGTVRYPPPPEPDVRILACGEGSARGQTPSGGGGFLALRVVSVCLGCLERVWVVLVVWSVLLVFRVVCWDPIFSLSIWNFQECDSV